jgi:hypothetical protein
MDPQQLAHLLTQVAEAIPAQVANQAAPEVAPAPQVSILSEFERKFGKTDPPHASDFTTHSDELCTHRRAQRPLLKISGYPTVTDQKERWKKAVFEEHNKSQRAHQSTLLEEAHDRMQRQLLLVGVQQTLSEEAKQTELAAGLTVEAVLQSLIDTNRDSVAKLRHTSFELVKMAICAPNDEHNSIMDLSEQEEEWINKWLDVKRARRAAQARRNQKDSANTGGGDGTDKGGRGATHNKKGGRGATHNNKGGRGATQKKGSNGDQPALGPAQAGQPQ